MPVATEHIYRIVAKYDRLGQELTNVFHYFGVNPVPPDPTGVLVAQFITSVIPSMRALTSVNVEFTEVVGENLMALTPIVVTPLTGLFGLRTGATTPSFVAASFRYNRATRELRSGWKRIGPMAEEDIGGEIFETLYITQMDLAATVFETDLLVGGDVYEPVVIRKPTVFPATTITYVNVTSVTALNRVTTQNSRKSF